MDRAHIHSSLYTALPFLFPIFYVGMLYILAIFAFGFCAFKVSVERHKNSVTLDLPLRLASSLRKQKNFVLPNRTPIRFVQDDVPVEGQLLPNTDRHGQFSYFFRNPRELCFSEVYVFNERSPPYRNPKECFRQP